MLVLFIMSQNTSLYTSSSPHFINKSDGEIILPSTKQQKEINVSKLFFVSYSIKFSYGVGK